MRKLNDFNTIIIGLRVAAETTSRDDLKPEYLRIADMLTTHKKGWVTRLKNQGYPITDIARTTGLSLTEVRVAMGMVPKRLRTATPKEAAQQEGRRMLKQARDEAARKCVLANFGDVL
jgi:DNA-directed RNA polymerase specialized sigma24 family protein